jgi:DNA-binding NarL/FixJ family response regulator
MSHSMLGSTELGQQFTKAIIAESRAVDGIGIDVLVKQHIGIVETLVVSNCDRLLLAIARDSDWSFATVDPSLPGLGGMHGITELRQHYPWLRVIVTSDHADRATALAAIDAGAHGFLPKALSVEDMTEAFSRVMDGHIYVPDQIADFVASPSDFSIAPHDELRAILTARQTDVLDLVAHGQSNKKIARELEISESTVKAHLAAVFRILGVKNRVGAAAIFEGWSVSTVQGAGRVDTDGVTYNRRQGDFFHHPG